jgi:hypothetical protein
MVAWAVSLSQRDTKPAGDGEPKLLIQGLDLDQIGIVTLGTGKDQVTLERQGKQFVVKEKESYPANTKQVNELLADCMNITTTDLYSSNPKNFEDLGVTETKARTIVRFAKADKQPITGVVIGNSRGEGGPGSYVRRTDSNDVYIATDVPYIQTGATSYLDQELLTLKNDTIASVTLKDPNGKSFTLVTDADNSETILMSNLPVGKKLQSSMARSVLTALTSVRFDDVSRTADPNVTFNYTYVAKLKDARVYTFKMAVADEGKVYAQVSAEYTDKVLIDPRKQDDPNELRAKEAKLKTQEQALTFTAKHNGWIYEIPKYKGQYLVKYQDELLEDLPKPEPAVDPNAAAPADPNVMDAAPLEVQDAIQGIMDPN